jgi:glycosyltransferase involved in cell wall biosynthesis
MRSLVLIVPGSLETRTGGYRYDRRIVLGLRERGWTVDVRELRDEFPFPTAAAREEAARTFAAIPDDSVVLMDGLALGALPDEVERESTRLRIVALVHHPLANETGIAASAAAELRVSEQRALAAVCSIVVTSRATAVALGPYGVARARIDVIEPGTDPAPLSRGRAARGESPQVALLSVATVTPRKGHDLLIRALAAIPHRNWTLTCAGSLDRAAVAVDRLRELIRASALTDQVRLVGDRDRAALDRDYDEADVFVLPTWYEGYGMAVAEALARGLPVVSTATGAIEDLVRGSESDPPAGIVLPPGDVPALADALSRVIGDAAYRASLAVGARQARERLPRWPEACAAMEHVIGRAERLEGRSRRI